MFLLYTDNIGGMNEWIMFFSIVPHIQLCLAHIDLQETNSYKPESECCNQIFWPLFPTAKFINQWPNIYYRIREKSE